MAKRPEAPTVPEAEAVPYVDELPEIQHVPIRKEGLTTEKIDEGDEGTALFRFDTEVYRAEVTAQNNIPKYGHIIVVETGNKAIWASPVLNIRQGYNQDDFSEVSYGTGGYTSYKIGTEAHKADSGVPEFTADLLKLTPTTDCDVKFNDERHVAHTLAADEQEEYYRKCTKIWVKGVSIPGTLEVVALG